MLVVKYISLSKAQCQPHHVDSKQVRYLRTSAKCGMLVRTFPEKTYQMLSQNRSPARLAPLWCWSALYFDQVISVHVACATVDEEVSPRSQTQRLVTWI